VECDALAARYPAVWLRGKRALGLYCGPDIAAHYSVDLGQNGWPAREERKECTEVYRTIPDVLADNSALAWSWLMWYE